MSTLLWLIAVGVPTVGSLIIIEAVVAKRRKIKIYTLSDSVTNLSCGILERIFNVYFSVIVLFGFNYVHGSIALFQIPLNIFTWIIGLLVTDLIGYWFHRLSHQVNFLWAAHIVHHQSEELNLTTVFRVSFFAVIFRAFFFVWMALIGFDVFTIVTTGITLGLYQFFTHSRVIGKLGFIEKFMTTPSHHRVHHGRNEKYLDRNYSHIFIIWDKLFGTFIEEEEEPEYGITSGFESTSAYDANFSYWKNLFNRAKKAHRFSDKIRVFIKAPKWIPEGSDQLTNNFKVDNKGNRLRDKISIHFERRAYIMLNILITTFCFINLLLLKAKLGNDVTVQDLIVNKQLIALVGIILVSIFAHSRIIEQAKYATLVDAFRLMIIVGFTVFGFSSLAISFWLIPAVFICSGLMLTWLLKLNSDKTG